MTAFSSLIASITRPAAKGFDFLGFHCCPTGVKVSDAALSRRDAKVARLYEQGASNKRIARYLARWLGWAAVVGASTVGHAETRIDEPETCFVLGSTLTFLPIGNFVSSDVFFGEPVVPAYQKGKCSIFIRGNLQDITIHQSGPGVITCSPSSPEYNTSSICTATPDTGFTPGPWGDACGTGSAATPCTLSNVTSAKTVSATFTAIPNYVPSGPVSDIIYDPTTPTTLYSALDGGGVYKKIGAGAWTAATAQPANLNVKALAIKADGLTLYAGTDGGGVFKSTDSGDTWAACATQPATPNIRSLALSGTTLYAGTTAGVFVSSDGCASWAAMSAGLP